jgi:hypothetical protein
MLLIVLIFLNKLEENNNIAIHKILILIEIHMNLLIL